MRDINAILKLFPKQNNLDYCSDFDIIAGILEFCDENIAKLEKVEFKGGNTEVISEIGHRINRHFKEKNYFNNDGELNYKRFDDTLRKITFFLVLNTKNEYKYDLKENKSVTHLLLENKPKLTDCLLANIIWDLKLDSYFYEILFYCPYWFTYKFIGPAITSVKYLKPYEVLEKTENLIKAIFLNISRSDLKKFAQEKDKVDVFEKILVNVAELLYEFYNPDIQKFSDWSKRKFFKYLGYAIQHLLNGILFCFDFYQDRNLIEQNLEPHYRIYQLCCTNQYGKIGGKKKNNQHLNICYSDLIHETQKKIIISLLDALQYNLILVTVDVFMDWAEIDLSEDITLQEDIGVKCYYLLEIIDRYPDLHDEIAKHLKFIARKPKSLEERIEEANIGTILHKLENSELTAKEKKLWFNELFNRTVVFGNEECLNMIRLQNRCVDLANCMRIVNYFKEQYGDNEASNTDEKEIVENLKEENDLLLDIFLNDCLKNLSSKDIVKLLLYSRKTFGKNSELFKPFDIQEKCTKFFNRWGNEFPMQDFLILCFMDPPFTLEQFLFYCCDSQNKIENFFVVLNKIQPLTYLYFEELFNASILEISREKFYSHYVYGFYHLNIIKKEEFFKDFIYCNVLQYLKCMDLEPIYNIIKGLITIVNKSPGKLSGFSDIAAPVLMMAAQIMDECRWDLLTYTETREDIIKICIDFIQITSKKFLPIASQTDRKWIAEKVLKYRLHTQFYFQKYSLNVTDTPKTFDEFLHFDKFTDDRDKEKFLTSNFVRCTGKETEWLARNEDLLPHFSDVILLIEDITNELKEEACIRNLRHCLINYINVLKKYLIPRTNDDIDFISEIDLKVLNIINRTPTVIYDEIFMMFHSVLIEIYTEMKVIEQEHVKEIDNMLENMKSCKGKELFEDKFKAIIAERLENSCG